MSTRLSQDLTRTDTLSSSLVCWQDGRFLVPRASAPQWPLVRHLSLFLATEPLWLASLGDQNVSVRKQERLSANKIKVTIFFHRSDIPLSLLYSLNQKQVIRRKKEKKVKLLSHVRLFGIPWTIAYQAPPSMGFSRQEYQNGLSFPSVEDFLDPGIEHGSPALQADLLPSEPPGKPNHQNQGILNYYYTRLSCQEMGGILEVCLSHMHAHII